MILYLETKRNKYSEQTVLEKVSVVNEKAMAK